MAMESQSRERRIVGIALVAGAVAMVVAALVDAMVGLRFLLNASTS